MSIDTIEPHGLPVPNPVILAAAKRVATAERASADAAASLAAAEANADALRRRQAELAGARTVIAARRGRGELLDDDGAALALISLDLEGVERLITEADAAVAAAEARQRQVVAALDTARELLRRHQDEAAERALTAHAEALGGLLLATCEQLAEIAQRLNRPDWTAWHPGAALWGELRRRAAGAGTL